jgi:hypothetical protein
LLFLTAFLLAALIGTGVARAEEEPEAACPPATETTVECLSLYVPPGVFPSYQGSGEQGGFSPADLRSAYNLPSTGGSGQTIAIVDAFDDPNAESDLKTYRSHYGLSECTTANGCFQKVNQKGEAKNYPTANAGWSLETSLDLDMASAICPGCHILLVEATSASFENMAIAEDEAATLGATEISDSWGGADSSSRVAEDSHYSHAGIPILVAAGDSGYGVEFPATVPTVISVGGTNLKTAGNARKWTETVWSKTGSGCSAWQTKPKWQTDASCSKRTDNDVAAVADPETPVSVYDSYVYEGWLLVGGTSASAPIMAGVEALSTAQARSLGAEAFYKAGPAGHLFDITEGKNGSCGGTYLCEAKTGYDGPTGWGTPNGVLVFAPEATTESASSIKTTKATLNGTVNPNGSETTYQFEYGTTTAYGSKTPASPKSIGSGTSPVKVSEEIEGLKAETTYHFRVVATNAGGTTEGKDQTFTTPVWEILSTLNPKGASNSELYDVSCEPSTSVCTSVGKSTASGVDSPVAQRWNGSSWSEQTPAKKSGSTHNRLLGVDCPSETRCIAVGNYQNSEGGPATLGELWNESKWSVQTTPVPSEASSSELVAVGCNSTASCRAAGSAVIKGTKTAIVEKWASPTWSSQSIPIPEGATSSQLDGIDCLWSSFCAAVGRYTTSGGSIKSLVMFWNGTEWSLQTVTDPEGATQSTLLDVACTPTPNRCTAVGGWKNSKSEQFTLAYRFNGVTTWTLQSTPNPAESIASVFQEVSCATETSCTAAGSWVSSGGGSNKTLAEKWNGSSWSIQGTKNPVGATFSAFFGVSCKESACIGVGYSTDGSGVDTTLGEIRE